MKRRCLAILVAGIVAWGSGCKDRDEVAAPIPRLPKEQLGKAEQRVVRAVESATAAVAKDRGSAAAWGQLGHVYAIHGWEETAAECYRRAAELAPNEFKWHSHLGRVLSNKDPRGAADSLAKAISLSPDFAIDRMYYGEVLKQLDRMEDARTQFQRAADLAPNNPNPHFQLGQLAVTEKRLDDARLHLHRATALNPQQSNAHAALAQVYLAMGDKPLADQHARLARAPLRSVPFDDPLWEEVKRAGVSAKWLALRGRNLLRKGRPGPAAEQLAAALETVGSDAVLWMDYGFALVETGRSKQAVEALHTALTTAEKNKLRTPEMDAKFAHDVLLLLARAYEAMGEKTRVEESLREAAAKVPDSPRANYEMARFCHSQGRLPEAIELLRRARRARPDPPTLRLLATYLRESGKVSEARSVEQELQQLERPAPVR